MSEETIFYVYVYLDSRKPGNYNYGKFSFDFEPFYIGKGKNFRMFKHLKEKSNERNINTYKYLKIQKIRNETGKDPIILKVFENLLEQKALDIEEEMILTIGRKCINTGPLANIQESGKQNSFFEHTEKTKKLISVKNKGKLKGISRSKEVIDKIKKTKKERGSFCSDQQKKDISNSLKEYFKTHDVPNKGKKLEDFMSKERAEAVSKKMSEKAKNRKTIRSTKFFLLDLIENKEIIFVGNKQMLDNFLKAKNETLYNVQKNKSNKYKLIKKLTIKVNRNYEEV